jgi:hypothetical protein
MGVRFYSFRESDNQWSRIRNKGWFGIWNVPQLQIKTNTEAEILLMEVPMQY